MTFYRLLVFPVPVSHGNYDTTSNSPHLRTESPISWHGLEHQKNLGPSKRTHPIAQENNQIRAGLLQILFVWVQSVDRNYTATLPSLNNGSKAQEY